MRSIYFSMALIGMCALRTTAQELFVSKAKITYEKKIRTAKELEAGSLGGLGESFANAGNTTWSLVFDNGNSLYKSIPINDEAAVIREAMNRNVKDEIYFNYREQTRVKKKMINKEAWLLEDSIPHLEWKLLPEIREIAGYECRKALTRINDTVYVVAFYTDRILMKGGPEGFNGLPGMILGLAIPRYRTTWFASKVELTAFDPKALQLPAGKKTDAGVLAADVVKSSSNPFMSATKQPEEIKKELLGFTL
jgi:GLPGLI family protein